ncbi:hypothetical protein PISMIDRAFT_690938 [Pisolithus microcarpus 441]|uniref:Uncharacterized protein n=1 Tax=Pisolithus microcarpus 441 TaxID=765257 RepID=A0A0C9XE82_9AGAM|nr:hypothetical protein PISMIDRAFT_690938 [Pisolithus microcarpus 441]
MFRGTRPGFRCPGLTHWSSVDSKVSPRNSPCGAPLSVVPGKGLGAYSKDRFCVGPGCPSTALINREETGYPWNSLHSPMGKLHASVLGQYKSNHQSRATGYEFLLVIYWQMATRVVSISGV